MHIKRMSAPKGWKMARKHYKWAVAPSPGPYSKDACIPLTLFLRDYVKLCDSAKEAKRICRSVMVDGKAETDPSYPLGLMASVSIGDEHYRITLGYDGLRATKIDADSAQTKLVRINNIRSVKGGKFQYSTHDGRNILMDEKKYATGTTLKIKVPEQEILESYELKEGNICLITKGKHMGKTAKVVSVQPGKVAFEGFEVPTKLVFVLGGESYA